MLLQSDLLDFLLVDNAAVVMTLFCVFFFYRNGHVMTHRTKKPFECSFEGCTKSYCDARSLRRHLENYHNVPTETLYDMSLTNYGMNNGKQASELM